MASETAQQPDFAAPTCSLQDCILRLLGGYVDAEFDTATVAWIDPATGVGGVYATQVLPFADKKSLPLFLACETAVYQNLS